MPLYLGDYYDSFRVMMVDPGLRSVGVSVWEFSTRSLNILDIDIETFYPDRIFNRSNRNREYGTELTYTLSKTRENIREIADRHDICALAHETPFFDRFRPYAYGVLSEANGAIQDGVLLSNPNTYIHGFSPQSVKKAIGAAGIKGKEIIREKISQDEEIMDVLNYDYRRLSEHCIDTLAIGKAFKDFIRKQEGW